MPIIIDLCDFCGAAVSGEKAQFEYEREDGDVNILCRDCMQRTLDEEFERSEHKSDGEDHVADPDCEIVYI